ncbi:hypothetical protein [Lysinibacillus fusiformis]|uniref:hypothetical protein n=1 Tax=Lysinibacillus fusiformis TaxID=28031 RepID=UPI0011A7163A|nr:hypothetical protein [Lysinibacillus fusiformis]
MDIVTSYDNWGGSGDRRSILSGSSVIFDGTEDTYITHGNGAQINIDIIFSGLEGKLYIDCIKVIRSQYAFINKEILLNGKLIGTFNDNVDHPLPMLTIRKNDKLTIRGKNNESGGGTYPTNIREIYFKTFFVPNKSFIYHEGLYKQLNVGEVSVASANAVPTMTSNTVPSGKVAFSSIYDSNYDGWKAFNKNESDSWNTLVGDNTNTWIQYEFPLANVVSSYSLLPLSTSSSNLNQMPNTWRFQGSNNGSDWDVLDSKSGVVWTSKTYKTYPINNNNFYNFYRLFILSNNGHSNVCIAEIKLSTKKFATAKEWTTVSNTLPKASQFLEKGMYLSPLLDRRVETQKPLEMAQRDDALDVGEVGRVFSKTIDLKKYFDIRSIRTEVR